MANQTENYRRESNSGVPNEVFAPSRVPQHEGIIYKPRIVKGKNVQCNGLISTGSMGGSFSVSNVASYGNSTGRNRRDDHNTVEVPIESQLDGGVHPSRPRANVPMESQLDGGVHPSRPRANVPMDQFAKFDIPIEAQGSGDPSGHRTQAQVWQNHTTNPGLDGTGQDDMNDIPYMGQLHSPILDDTRFYI